MTDEQLSALEGNTREAVIARLKRIEELKDRIAELGHELSLVLDRMPHESTPHASE